MPALVPPSPYIFVVSIQRLSLTASGGRSDGRGTVFVPHIAPAIVGEETMKGVSRDFACHLSRIWTLTQKTRNAETPSTSERTSWTWKLLSFSTFAKSFQPHFSCSVSFFSMVTVFRKTPQSLGTASDETPGYRGSGILELWPLL